MRQDSNQPVAEFGDDSIGQNSVEVSLRDFSDIVLAGINSFENRSKFSEARNSSRVKK